ncbi:unnamed protein product [Orchesella dallaii]|uniref:C2H2-type domain-containing protein n=1 Tax=Orchesella dallaii TaxID=48710 RepID=A0ABP1R7B9_9HEXA
MVSAWGLQCFLCKTTFDTRKEWLAHLLQPLHQNQARVNCLSWDKQIKECVLIAFSSFPVAKEDVLHIFQLRDRNTIVTDFVWSEHRPRVGIIQFESREKADEVLEESRRNPIVIHDQLIQLRKGSDFMDLEWDELLERFQPNKNAKNTTSSNPSKVKETTKVKPSRSFHLMFDDICDEIVIPDKSFNLALDIMEKCRQVFATRYPSCNLYMFRHWYLQLKTMGTNELLFCLDANGQLANDDPSASNLVTAFFLSTTDIEKFLTSPSAQEILPGVRKLEEIEENGESRAFQFVHEPSGLKFSIVADSLFLTEVQTCRLVKYLWEFDPRVRPFFILILYWAKQNLIELSYPIYKDPVKSHAFAPEPAALEWLMLTFLARKGVVPKPFEILVRPHKQLLLFKKGDVGFATDAQFVSEWSAKHAANVPPQNSNEFFLNVMELVRDFFVEISKLRSGRWIVNTRDSEIIAKDDFFMKEPQREWETRLTIEEISNLKFATRRYTLTQVNLEQWAISLLHPLFIEWCITFSNSNFWSTSSRTMEMSGRIVGASIHEIRDRNIRMSLRAMLRKVSRGRRQFQASSTSALASEQRVKKRKLDVTDDN